MIATDGERIVTTGRVGDAAAAWAWLSASGDPPPFAELLDTTSPAAVYGTVELVDPDRIQYTVPGYGVVASYEPAPADYEPTVCF